MMDTLRRALQALDVDYADIRFDEERKTKLALSGRDIAQVAAYNPRGGYVRAYVRGGKAIASFSRIEEAAIVAQQTAAAARLAARHTAQAISLAPAPVLEESFLVTTEHDPRRVSLAQKNELLQHYNEAALGHAHVLTTQFFYDDSFAHRAFANTEGTAVEYEYLIATILGVLVGRRGDTAQRGLFAAGGSGDFGRLISRDEGIKRAAAELDELLGARPAQAGRFPVVLDPFGAAIFIHEAFGHRSEADLLQHNPAIRERMALGTRIGSPILNVSDDPTLPDCAGSYPVDDEGVRGRRTRLIVDGHIVGRLHSRETAAVFGEPLTGNCRAVDAGYGPIVRMSNTMIEPGVSSVGEMIASIDDGFYVAGGGGGQGGIDFTFASRWARRIRNGRLAEVVSDANLSGNLFTTLKAISMIGDDFQMIEGCDCGKGSPDGHQQFARISAGAPHIKLDVATIGGIEC
ncbi:TldD/PmbA family protein [Candidatus Bipolaricaulota bacterium]|nr:TldD/PmbA family protein [Candidatus Bipolaricaulota bacterium]